MCRSVYLAEGISLLKTLKCIWLSFWFCSDRLPRVKAMCSESFNPTYQRFEETTT